MEFRAEYEGIPKKMRLDSLVANKTGRSRSFVKWLVNQGYVRINSVVAKKVSQGVQSGDFIWVILEDPPLSALTPVPGVLEILFEDEHLLFLNKPQGLVVHPAPTWVGDTLVHYLLHHLKTKPEFTDLSSLRPGIVHRLDKGTSGVMVVGKHRECLEGLSHLFSSRQIHKTYHAIVWGSPPKEGTSHLPIGRHPFHRMKMSSKGNRLREASTYWRVQREFRHFTHLELTPHSGRTHQIRVHLSELCFPICGDKVYGGRRSKQVQGLPAQVFEIVNAAPFPFLHAKKLSFTHPITKLPLDIEAPYPLAYRQLLNALTLLEKG